MSAYIKHVKPEHESILREYFDKEGVVLIFGKENIDKSNNLGFKDGSLADGYDFGGESDVYLDLVYSDDHHIFDFMEVKL